MLGRTSPDLGHRHCHAVTNAVADTGSDYTCTLTDAVTYGSYANTHTVTDAVADTEYICIGFVLHRLAHLGQTWTETL